MDIPTSKQLPRDVFLYFLMMFVLAVSAANIGTILFQFINLYVPGAVGYYGGYAQGLIRWSVSSLVIVFPVLVWVIRFLKRDMAKTPAKRDLKIRKWLLYFALFITGITVIGDLITLVYSFMQGDVTTRFLLKVAVVFWLAGSIFYYFLKDLHEDAPKARRLLEWVTIVIVAATLIGGFIAAGSPASQRAQANDNQRVWDLQSLESQIISYWQDKGSLPATVADLPSGTISGYIVPVDPVTQQPYDYARTSTLGYRLCATFEQPTPQDNSVPQLPPGYGVGNWQHGAGQQCFTGVIDPQRYKGPLVPVPVK